MSTTTLRCPVCVRDVPAGSMFCPWDGSPLDRMTPSGRRVDPLLLAQVGEYVIQERIGAGGMGIVYRAVQPLIGKQVAIKILREEFAESEEQVQRLLVEARAVNAIGHRSIIDIFGFGTLQDGRPYVVMELLQGVSLDAFIRQQGRLEVATTVRILDEMLSALGAAHRQGIIHRDLKPGNVFLMDDPDGGRSVKLLDFGIAKLTEGQSDGPKTLGGVIMGTPAFMAPEQVQGKPVSPRTDLYAVGMIAFQMLTGKLAYDGEPTQVLLMQLSEPPPVPSSRVPDLPPEVDALVLQLLAKDPEQRFGSTEEVRQALQQLLHGAPASPRTEVLAAPELPDATSATPPTPTAPSAPTGRMGVPEAAPVPAEKPVAPAATFPWKWVGAGAAGVLLAVGVGVAILNRPVPPPKPAIVEVTPPKPQVVAEPAPLPIKDSRESKEPEAGKGPLADAQARAGEEAGSPEAEPAREETVKEEPPEETRPSDPGPRSNPRTVAIGPRPGPQMQPEVKASTRPVTEPVRPSPPPRKDEATVSGAASFEHDALLARLKALEQRMARAGGSTNPLAGKRLASLRTRAESARTLSERKALVIAMDIWERDFLKN